MKKMSFAVLMTLALTMILTGCGANSSRNLTVNVRDHALLLVCHSTVSPEVTKTSNTEAPSTTNTPEIQPNINLPGGLVK